MAWRLMLGIFNLTFMQKLSAILLFFTIISGISASAQGNPDPKLEWNEFYKVTWSDFQGKPSQHSNGDAATAVQIKAKPFYVKDEINYDVMAYFNRQQSWARTQSDALLAHEQLHFDIAELYARKIRKEIARLKNNKINDVETINAAIRVLLAESDRIDIQYDAETLHGGFAKKQAKWAAKIKQELTDLEQYKKTRRVVSMKKAKRRTGFFASL
jgi:hypothetical protein